ncbi:MAG: hypothetical protein EP330_13075 [Deltaproteobacteria bacterium]|nr:MAG: hypothetical protein EP330_13075 [Deltaproteobacteria bacterium]
MSYFDHVKCTSCRAQLDPESLVAIQGTVRCPRCGGHIAMKDLFGLRDAFAEEDAPQVTIDDLVPGGPARGGASTASRGPARAAPRHAPPSDGRQLPARTGEAADEGGGSAMDALRSLRKKK